MGLRSSNVKNQKHVSVSIMFHPMNNKSYEVNAGFVTAFIAHPMGLLIDVVFVSSWADAGSLVFLKK